MWTGGLYLRLLSSRDWRRRLQRRGGRRCLLRLGTIGVVRGVAWQCEVGLEGIWERDECWAEILK
jgi:hypothetical protein